jgi:hypothetical protein
MEKKVLENSLDCPFKFVSRVLPRLNVLLEPTVQWAYFA